MKNLSMGVIVFVTLCMVTFSASAKELIREFKGSESKSTMEFKVKAPWIVDWRTTGDYPGQMAVDISLVKPTGEYVGKIAMTKWVDNGVRLLDEGGTYRFQVNSTLASWTLRVIELTRAEAETYLQKEHIE